jgi:class 3 adenylate cyclase/tetratricopeptide (TPR) repeat protein
MSDELRCWLEQIGLAQHAETFAASDIDLDVLPELSDEDLKELGLSLGHRRRLLRAIVQRTSESVLGAAPDTPSRDAERRQLTVLFCDLVGSTELSRRFDPEDLRELIRRYQDAVSGAVVRHGGYVANFLGDGIIAYFGWPHADEDNAAQAVLAGLDAIIAVRELSLRAHAGIASGPVVVGDLDTAGRRQTGAVAGETPNLAARLEALAEPDQVVIDELTRQLIGAAFALEEIGPQNLKGFAEPVQAWRVVGERPVESRFEARAGRLTPFVGRQQEMALLLERFERAATGEGQAVLLAGEAGIGKSRLVQMLHERLLTASSPPTRIRMQCAPFHAASALHPVIRHLRYAAGFLDEDGPEERLDKLEALIRQGADNVRESAALLAPLLSLPDDRYGVLLDLTPEQRNERLMRALVDQLLGLAVGNTVLYVLEDAHWIDAATRDLIERLLARMASSRILVLITHRPEFRPDWTRHPHVTTLTLNRLSRGQAVEVARAAGGAMLSEEIVAIIGERAGGVPLFIEELTKSALEDGKTSDESHIPETLQASLLARLDRLGGEARELAQLAAVIGREFDTQLLCAVTGKKSEAIAPSLEGLVGSEIVLPAGSARYGAYVFRHALIQEAAYQSLLLARRRQYHRDVAFALEAMQPGAVEPEIIAQHYTAAELPEQAVPHWLRAGEGALGRFAGLAAAAHFERGLQLARGLPQAQRQVLELLLALGSALDRTERLRDALATFKEAAALALEVGSPVGLARAALGVEDTELYTGAERASVELLEAALVALDPGETVLRCRVLSQLGRALLDRGEVERANELSRAATDMARHLGDRRALLDVLLCERAARTGYPYSASQFLDIRRALDEMLAAAEEIGDPNLVERALGRVVPVVLEMGDRAAFEAQLARHGESLQQHELNTHLYFNVSGRAMRAILSGEFAEAERLAGQALEAAREFRNEYADGVYGVQMFTIRREQGRLAEVAPILRRFIDENPRDAAWRPGMALIASDLGFHDAARKSFEDLAAGGFAFPFDAKRTLTLSYLAEVCSRLGDVDQAERLYDLLLPYRDLAVIAPTTTVCCGSAARYLGMLAATLGDWGEAEEHFAAALTMDEQLQAWPWLAHTKHEFGLMLRARGRPRDHDHAAKLIAAAAASAERIGMPALQQKIRLLGR